ncbi:MAG: DUF4344 domain-containing metallopeptidase [Pseudomonas sp.]|uniref:DUF4344 domain-containing metallopeptidase n=1 Tax=Pseudomonas sp. TaxID=306 RepID=UPI00339B2849
MTSFAKHAFALLGSLWPLSASALTQDDVKEAKSFMLNNSVYVLYHEIGHLFVGEFELPVLGKEEDAADNVATLMLLAEDTDASAAALNDAANGWYLSEYSDEATHYENADFYDNHSLDIQRSYAIVCLMVGSDAEKFGEIADEFDLDKDRQEGCASDFAQAVTSWDSLLASSVRDGKAGKAIKVEYESGGDDYQEVANILKGAKFLEQAAALVTESYVLPRKITFTGKVCGEANAYYSPGSAEVIYCYELADYFYGLKVKDIAANEEGGDEEADDEEEVAVEEEDDEQADEESPSASGIRGTLSTE